MRKTTQLFKWVNECDGESHQKDTPLFDTIRCLKTTQRTAQAERTAKKSFRKESRTLTTIMRTIARMGHRQVQTLRRMMNVRRTLVRQLLLLMRKFSKRKFRI